MKRVISAILFAATALVALALSFEVVVCLLSLAMMLFMGDDSHYIWEFVGATLIQLLLWIVVVALLVVQWRIFARGRRN